MKILAIETSCDETAIAMLEARSTKHEARKINFVILSNQVSSQVKIHRPFGGVVPNLAKREHIKNLPILLKRVLGEAKIQLGIEASKLDLIAVTNGPGLEPALWTGIAFAKELSEKWKMPIVAVNHLEGHIYAAWLGGENSQQTKNPKFPLLALIVSGGHTELVLMKKHLDYKILGETLDDAAGEAFDKVARMLGLNYPGGPEISKLAEQWKTKSVYGGKRLFPRPMINSKDLNFSFSGLKTSVLYTLRAQKPADEISNAGDLRSLFAYEFQEAVVEVLVKKTLKAVEQYKPKTVVLGGGVAANERLREELSKKIPGILLPEKIFTGDNAAMIAVAGYFKAIAGKFSKPENIKADGRLKLG